MTDKALFNKSCKSCPRLAQHLASVRREFPDYHAAPVPPFGVSKPQLLIVGLAPGLHGANATGRPFTGDHAGIILYKTLFKYGFSTGEMSVSATDKLRLKRCRITNAVKCLPPENKPTTAEVVQCNSFLSNEITVLPQDAVIMALGSIAHGAVLRALGLRAKAFPFAHGHCHSLKDGRRLLDSYHCSRYNTNTRRLTPAMFDAVFERAVDLLGD
jgi:uracil-DNA glycosylase family 4